MNLKSLITMFKFWKNWRTTLAGIAIALLTALRLTGKLPPEVYEYIIGLLVAAGLIAANDANNFPPPPAPAPNLARRNIGENALNASV